MYFEVILIKNMFSEILILIRSMFFLGQQLLTKQSFLTDFQIRICIVA